MKKIHHWLSLALVLAAGVSHGQTTVTANQGAPGKQGPWPVTIAGGASIIIDIGDGGIVAQQGRGQDGGAWNVSGTVGVSGPVGVNILDGGVVVLNSPTVNQGFGIDGGSAWNVGGTVAVSNFPASWFPDGGTIGIVSVSNFPAVQAVSQSGPWTVSIDNFPASQTVNGTVSVDNFPATWFPDGGSIGSVSIDGPVTSNQGLSSDGGTSWAVEITNVDPLPVYLPDAAVVIQGSSPWLVAGADAGVVEVGGTVIAPPATSDATPAVVTREKWKSSSSVTTTSVSCGTTATSAPGSVATNRTSLTLYNNSVTTIYIGGAGVTTADGLPLLPGASWTDNVMDTPYYCVVATGTADLRALEN